MELDLAGMHQLAAGQGIDPETLDAALSEALRLAYLKTLTLRSTLASSLIRVREASPYGPRTRFLASRLKTIPIPRRLWARNTTTLRTISADWPLRPLVR